MGEGSAPSKCSRTLEKHVKFGKGNLHHFFYFIFFTPFPLLLISFNPRTILSNRNERHPHCTGGEAEVCQGEGRIQAQKASTWLLWDPDIDLFALKACVLNHSLPLLSRPWSVCPGGKQYKIKGAEKCWKNPWCFFQHCSFSLIL